VCVTAPAPRRAVAAERDAIVGADLVELRLDSVAIRMWRGPAGRKGPYVTCRPGWEAEAQGSEESAGGCRRALALGAEHADVEWRAHFDDLIAQTGGRRIVLSSTTSMRCRLICPHCERDALNRC
jgi:hypothetical protein